MPKPPTLSKDEIADALLRSGYLIEYRIEEVLRGQGPAPMSLVDYVFFLRNSTTFP